MTMMMRYRGYKVRLNPEEGTITALSKYKGTPLYTTISNSGYRIQYLYIDGKLRNTSLHQMMMECCVGKRPEGYCINHKDGDKLNNKLSNLEYVTYKENIHHALRTGLHSNKYHEGRTNCKKYRSSLEMAKYYSDPEYRERALARSRKQKQLNREK